jgi:hypothetical protein
MVGALLANDQLANDQLANDQLANDQLANDQLANDQNEIRNPTCPSRPGSTCVIERKGSVVIFSRFWIARGF